MYKLGALDPKVDIRDYTYEPAMSTTDEEELPVEFKILNTPKIKDQGNVGSCVAHVAAEIEEYHNKIQQDSDEELSVGYVYGCRYEYTGEGMYLRDALKTLKNRGICTYNEFPYNREVPEIIDLFTENDEWKTDAKNKISSYFSISTVNRDYKIKKALLSYGPVMVAIKWYNDFKVDENGIISSSFTGNNGGHCVMIYGWTKDGWLIQNSWGKKWGIDGTAIYPFEYPLNEVWGVTDTIVHDADDVKKTKLNTFLDLICKIINGIINLFK